ncbi:hypothetical protein Nepgr_010214 [Nepenthes gracilis]|uniref:Uncharacterized protein n=1 Tax=Nepenthes gracilis TaxID=150966 RepID=A0AAD3SCY4_NEPGR|nr:hypothetical protein Nepgr_010214 [Nepenthes gracilis]
MASNSSFLYAIPPPVPPSANAGYDQRNVVPDIPHSLLEQIPILRLLDSLQLQSINSMPYTSNAPLSTNANSGKPALPWISHHRLPIPVHQHNFIAFLLQELARRSSRVIELARLPYYYCPAPTTSSNPFS